MHTYIKRLEKRQNPQSPLWVYNFPSSLNIPRKSSYLLGLSACCCVGSVMGKLVQWEEVS